MKVIAELAAEFELASADLLLWIERRWVLPLQQDGEFIFSETDVARVRMIVELRRDLAIDDEAMGVVLDLLDKLYGVRRQMRDLLAAVAELPEAQRETLMQRIGGGPREPSGDR